ncbi:MAG TPA: hypothetical protein VN030_09380 [Cellvibrio sp.]|nr:hypothetical protein [Cellvibrio sp.]
MHTKTLMTLSALLMAIAGLAASFAPAEILTYLDAWSEVVEVTLVQVLGALYLGFAALNWTARGNLIGGLYSRPVALANFMHAGVVTITLAKVALANHNLDVIIAAAVYGIFALWFAAVLFSKPQLNSN